MAEVTNAECDTNGLISLTKRTSCLVHKRSWPGPSIHRIGQSPVRSSAQLPWSGKEVVKVTDSVPACRRAHRVPRAGVAKDGVADVVSDQGERLAARYQVRSGTQIPDRTWGCVQGESDIVVMDDACLVNVEVRTRRSPEVDSPSGAVAALKAARLRRLGFWRGAVPA